MASHEDENFYISDDAAEEDVAEYPSDGDSDGVDDVNVTKINYYKILKEETMKQLQQNDIAKVSDLLAVAKSIACTLLLRHNWSVSAVTEEWFADVDKVRAAVGLSTNHKRQKLEQYLYCKICLESVEYSRTLSAVCGHLFCSDCCTKYVSFSINDGPGCLRLRCPEPKCGAVVGLDMVEAVATAEDQRRFHHYLYRSYVESNRNRKWCPGPGCEFAVELDDGGAAETYDVTCECGYKFCWRCTEEQHRPVGCETVAKWAEKNKSEEDNTTWILAYTKSCPGCGKKIEKNQGCNHMTCTCAHEFCWFCMQKWKADNSHVCNKYDRDMQEDIDCALTETRDELERYYHFYERWFSNHKSREIAQADLVRARNERLPELSAALKLPETELQFVVDAWEQIIECRRVLKWSYTYGYYIKERMKMELFEDWQGRAEAALERLHQCAEKEMTEFIKAGRSAEELVNFREKLATLTGVTKKCFQTLVTGLENDLPDVGAASSS